MAPGAGIKAVAGDLHNDRESSLGDGGSNGGERINEGRVQFVQTTR